LLAIICTQRYFGGGNGNIAGDFSFASMGFSVVIKKPGNKHTAAVDGSMKCPMVQRNKCTSDYKPSMVSEIRQSARPIPSATKY
jgi:hypothetical protein